MNNRRRNFNSIPNVVLKQTLKLRHENYRKYEIISRHVALAESFHYQLLLALLFRETTFIVL